MRRTIRREGLRGVIRRIGQRVRLSREGLFYMRVLTKPLDGFQPLLPLYLKRFTGPTVEFRAIHRTFTDDTAFANRFSGRVFCDVAFVYDVPVAFLWTSLGDCEVPSLNATLRLALKDAYLMEAYTKLEYRQKGISVFLRNSVCQELSALGYNRLFGLSDIGNRPMIQLAEKTGFDPYYLISTRRLAPFERLIATPYRPEFAGALRVERVGRGLLPFRRPRWTLTLTQPDTDVSSVE